MSKTDRRTKIMDAQQTSEVRELTDAELHSVNGGSSPGLLEFAAGVLITAVGEVWIPLIRAGVL